MFFSVVRHISTQIEFAKKQKNRFLIKKKAHINGAFVEIMLKAIREISWMKNNRFLSYSFDSEERNE